MKKHHNATHGMSKSKVYRVWHSMNARCKYPSVKCYQRYGGSGVTVCDRWKDFSNFYEDMGEPPRGLTLDRIDNSKGYEPGNCRWATHKEQSQNSRTPKLFTFNGQTKNITEWAEELGITQSAVHLRLMRWPLEKALGTKRTNKSKTGNFQILER